MPNQIRLVCKSPSSNSHALHVLICTPGPSIRPALKGSEWIHSAEQITCTLHASEDLDTPCGSDPAFARQAITSSRQQLLESSVFRSSSLALPRYGGSGNFTSLGLSSPCPIKRHVSSEVAVRSGIKELLTHSDKEKVIETLEFYIQEIRSSDPSDTTATLKVANLPVNTKPLQWGSSFVFDNEVREGSGANTTLLGRERGWGIVSDRESKEALQLLSKISFSEGKYKDSTLTFSGNVGGVVMPYELIILGGTGRFRGAHGYALVDNVPNEGARFKFHWSVVVYK